jgi:hypothetical protein
MLIGGYGSPHICAATNCRYLDAADKKPNFSLLCCLQIWLGTPRLPPQTR